MAARPYTPSGTDVRRLNAKFSHKLKTKQVICLDIPDDYTFMDEKLIEILMSRVSEYIQLPEGL